MSTPHKAKPVDWVVVEESGSRFSSTDSCLLELRARVEALEADGPAVPSREPTPASSLVKRRPLRCPTSATIAECGGPCEQGFHLCDCGLLEQLNPELRGPAPASSLVERVAKGIGSASPWMHSHRDEARAAIREVAAWLRDRADHWSWVAQVLEKEAGR
jgi:hypothetical protein